MTYRRLAGALVGLLFGFLAIGCAGSTERVSNGDRQLSYQNKSAAEKIMAAAAEVQSALMMMGVPAPAAATAAVQFIASAAADIRDNSSAQIKGWGGEEVIKGKADYSHVASEAARKATDEEHARMTKWALGISAAATLLGALVTGVGSKIPYIGPFLAMLNFGEKKEASLSNVLQAGISEARDKYDELAARLRSSLDGSALEKLGGLIPDGNVLKDRLVAELERKGLLALNTAKYEANPLIPETPPPAAAPPPPAGA